MSLKGTASPAAFLEMATKFANQVIAGSLCATLVIHPSLEVKSNTEKGLMYVEEVDTAIAALEYGTVTINVWPALSYSAIEGACWGGYPVPGFEEPWLNTELFSGVGFVRNAFMINHVEKTVLKTPFFDQYHIGTCHPSDPNPNPNPNPNPIYRYLEGTKTHS